MSVSHNRIMRIPKRTDPHTLLGALADLPEPERDDGGGAEEEGAVGGAPGGEAAAVADGGEATCDTVRGRKSSKSEWGASAIHRGATRNVCGAGGAAMRGGGFNACVGTLV